MTKDEELNIARCLDSVRWSDDVVVLDSYSTDRTVEIARKFRNVRVFQNKFLNYADQRNFGLSQIAYQNPWLLVLDADEVVQDGLAREILGLMRCARDGQVEEDAFMLRRNPVLEGRALRHNYTARCWIARLLRVGAVRYEGIVHERVILYRSLGRLDCTLDHHQFSKGMTDWVQRRTNYASLEQNMKVRGELPTASLRKLLFGNLLERRASLKACFANLPLRWLIYLAYNVIIAGAWRDGRIGLRYVYLEASSIRSADQKISKTTKGEGQC